MSVEQLARFLFDREVDFYTADTERDEAAIEAAWMNPEVRGRHLDDAAAILAFLALHEEATA